MRKTIITSSKISNEYKEKLLHNTSISFGIQVLPFDAYFFPETTNQDHQIYVAHHLLKKENFKHLGDLFSFPLTINNLIDFNKELQCYNIPFDNLPTETEYDCEIKKALMLLKQEIKPIDENIFYIAQGLTHAQLTYLRNHKAQEIIDDTWNITPSHYAFKSGLNQRQEIEGLIQHLLREPIENPLVLVPNLAQSIPYFKSVFSRLKIPYESQDSKLKENVYQYITLLDYYVDPTIDNIYKVIESQVFELEHPQQLLHYLKFYRATKEQFFGSLEYAHNHYLLSDFYEIQTMIETDHQHIKEHLTTLSALTLEEALIYILNHIKHTSQKSALPIQTYLQNTLSAINIDTLHILKQGLNNLINETFQTPFLTLKTYNDLPLYPVDTLFILGLSAKNYPAIKAPSGILDTSYRHRVKSYPTQSIQNEHQMLYKELIFTKAHSLILSVHELTFEGKSLELANRISEEAKIHHHKFTPWKLSESDPNYKLTKKLSPEVARDLYLEDNGLLKGSVSSFERYVSDPYTYFIEKGLNIKQPVDYNLLPRLRGSINHKVLETGILDMQETLFPQNDAYLPHFVRINKQELKKHLDFIEKSNDSTLLTPFKRELKVISNDLFKGISFVGFIDRIDKLNNNSYMIIDYKSSAHTLSKSELEKGGQLQLLTYVLAFKATLDDTASILGSYYYIFDKKKADTPKYKYCGFSKTKGITEIPPLTQEDLNKQYSLKGWTYNAIDSSLVPDALFAGRTLTNLYSLDNLEDFMHEMYEHLRTKILNGVLDAEDLELPFRSVDVKGDQ